MNLRTLPKLDKLAGDGLRVALNYIQFNHEYMIASNGDYIVCTKSPFDELKDKGIFWMHKTDFSELRKYKHFNIKDDILEIHNATFQKKTKILRTRDSLEFISNSIDYDFFGKFNDLLKSDKTVKVDNIDFIDIVSLNKIIIEANIKPHYTTFIQTQFFKKPMIKITDPEGITTVFLTPGYK